MWSKRVLVTCVVWAALAAPAAAGGIAEETGVTGNSAIDLSAFLSGLLFNGCIGVGCLLAFSLLRLHFPRVYANNVVIQKVPFEPAKSFFGWATASVYVSTEQAAEVVGVDSAMLLEFSVLCMRLSGCLAVPLCVILGLLYSLLGGNAAGEDHLGTVDMGNVKQGHPWIPYVQAGIVWGVCIVVHWSLCRAQAKFLPLRFAWLKSLPTPRADTVLIEDLPVDFRSDAELKDFFVKALGDGSVREAHVVKHASELRAAVDKREALRERVHEAELRFQHDGSRPQARLRCCGPKVDVLEQCPDTIEELTERILAERARIRQADQNGDAGVNSGSAFVTFSGRREAELARGLHCSADRLKWHICAAPELDSVRWQDLTWPSRLKPIGSLLGYAIVILLILFFMPISAFITNLGKLVKAGPLWAALAPTIGLQIMMAFLPSILLAVFGLCFVLRAEMWAQHHLQVWYYVFQVIFVILVTAIGTSLFESMKKIAEDPLSFPQTLAMHMPSATHFYMNYIVLQWAAYCLDTLRLANLVKFYLYRTLYTPDEAVAKAEPEDQSYQGFGSRYARLAIIMAVCIIFSTLSPLVAPLAVIHFALCRLTYGYLIVFAETRKADTGGAFWVTALKHIQVATLIYALLMVGVLSSRAPNGIPAAIASPSILFVLWSFYYLDNAYDWKKLPFEIIVKTESLRCWEELDKDEAYIQPELLDDKDTDSRQETQTAVAQALTVLKDLSAATAGCGCGGGARGRGVDDGDDDEEKGGRPAAAATQAPVEAEPAAASSAGAGGAEGGEAADAALTGDWRSAPRSSPLP